MFFQRNNHSSRAKKLPKPVRDYMMRKFDLLPEYLDLLRCLEYPGLFKGKEVMYVNIFSPGIAEECHLSIKTNLELEQHPEMLLFGGYIDRQGSVYIADQRKPAMLEKSPYRKN